jgi:hypothetical protein
MSTSIKLTFSGSLGDATAESFSRPIGTRMLINLASCTYIEEGVDKHKANNAGRYQVLSVVDKAARYLSTNTTDSIRISVEF